VKLVPTKPGEQAPVALRLGHRSECESVELLSYLEALDHPNIIRYHHFVQNSEALHIVMDRCEGPDLQDHVDACGGLLPWADVSATARQLLSGLAYVHAVGLMHRDLKPENCRFKDQEATQLQLLDFGSAKLAGVGARQHTVTGTLLYAAPEVFDGWYDRSCDMWSAGIVLFLLISGQLPFQTSDLTILRSMHRDPVLTGDCLFRGKRWNEAPVARQLLRGLLSLQPSARLDAAAAAAHTLPEVEEEDEHLPTRQLRRCDSGKLVASLKRTAYVWNLVESKELA